MKKAEDHRVVCAVDFHTHLLPGMDDGSASVTESRAMLDLMGAQGVTAAVLTPHFYPERESPDVIIISGDLVSRSETNFETVGKTLAKLCRIAPVYMIFGNHEQSMLPEMQKKFLETVSLTDARLLRNENDVFEKNGRRITIYGLEEHYEVYKKNGGYRDLEIITPEDMQTYLGDIADEEVWLIAHNPFFAESYSQWGADVVFSGHVHGGSVRLFGRAILSPERVFFPKNSKGVYEFGRTKLLVSAGLGKLRLFNPPEVVVYVI